MFTVQTKLEVQSDNTSLVVLAPPRVVWNERQKLARSLACNDSYGVRHSSSFDSITKRCNKRKGPLSCLYTSAKTRGQWWDSGAVWLCGLWAGDTHTGYDPASRASMCPLAALQPLTRGRDRRLHRRACRCRAALVLHLAPPLHGVRPSSSRALRPHSADKQQSGSAG